MSKRGEKLLTFVLIGACALFFVLALAFQFGVGAGYSWLDADADANAAGGAAAIDRTPFKLRAQDQFAVVYERPLFNEDRQPSPYVETEQPATPDTPPVQPLNVTLTGTVQSPGVRLAMLFDKSKNLSIPLGEGMPLPGDQGGWTLTKIRDRSVVFKSTEGTEQELELVAGPSGPKNGGGRAGNPAAPAQPGAPPAFGPGANAGAPPPPPPVTVGNNNTQAADLQRRVEERRAQMREAAERAKKQNPPGQPPP